MEYIGIDVHQRESQVCATTARNRPRRSVSRSTHARRTVPAVARLRQ
jgi:hypothetical protein